ncbi:MAG TPA: PIN domain-containing protein [Actinomycetota bacterium]|nr:PIN domain-containing protein [Actinomycetota bacterium]
MRFVDTSFWIALRFRRDRRHPDARALWENGARGLITSHLVLGETWTFLCRRLGHREAARFRAAALGVRSLTIAHIDERLEAEAWRWLDRHDERSYSFVDSTSFALMRRMRLREALAFDGDFAAAGFVEVRPT